MSINSYCIESTTNTLIRATTSKEGSRRANLEDEDRPPSFNPSDCAQSLNLRTALETMRTVNPDTILALFPSQGWKKYSRDVGNKVQVRTSSANWAGADSSTVEEGVEYARKMWFTK